MPLCLCVLLQFFSYVLPQVRELYTSGSVCPHPSKTYMQADALNYKGEYKVRFYLHSDVLPLK
jgi:hypothetical protein